MSHPRPCRAWVTDPTASERLSRPLSCDPLARRAQDSNGSVVKKHVPHLNQWNRTYSIEKLLVNIRGLFGKPEFRKLTNQPGEGETYA